jgi:proton glutamate symport protein
MSSESTQDNAPSKKKGMQLYTKILIGMSIGVILGFFFGPNSQFFDKTGLILTAKAQVVVSPDNPVLIPHAAGVEDMEIIEERAGDPPWVKVNWTLNPRDVVRLQAAGVSAASGSLHVGWVLERRPEVRRYFRFGQKLVDWTEWLGRLFLALIKMVVVPLVFFSLVVGIASMGDFRKLGRMGGTTLLFFTLTTIAALAIGLILTNILQPGDLLSEADRANLLMNYSGAAGSKIQNAVGAPTFVDQIVAIVPKNPFAALASGDMLAVIFFATILGVAFTLMEETKAKIAVDVFESINDAVVMMVHIAMKIAPIGVGALLFEVVGSTGLSVLVALGYYAAVVVFGLLLHITLVYASVIKFIVKVPVLDFLKALRSALVLAFSTSSSSATLPVTKECCDSNLGIDEATSSFVLPIGATVNMDGTALYQGVAAVFIAQIYGIDLTLGDQITIVVSATMASVGAAGVPGAGMVTLAMVLTAIGVPTQGVALVLGVDRILDMLRTTTNVIGDATATALIATTQGQTLRVRSPDADQSDPEHGMEGRLENS